MGSARECSGPGRAPARRLIVAAITGAMASLAALSAAWIPASADSSSFSSNNVDVGGPIKSDTPIPSSDHISIGWSIADHDHSNSALLLSISNADAYVGFSCKPGSPAAQFTLTIPLSHAPLSYPRDYTANGGWYPSNTPTDANTYQAGSFVFGSLDQCTGSAYVIGNAVRYTGTLAATNHTGDLFHIQFHTAITQKGCAPPDPGAGTPACNFAWNWNTDNLSASYQPAPTPSPSPVSSPAPGLSQGAGSSATNLKSQVKAAATHAARPAHPPGPVSAGARQAPQAPSGVPPAGGWARSGLAPLPVIAPLVSNAADSLFEHVPIPMLSVLAAIDVVLALLLIDRKRRLHDRTTSD